VRWALLAVALAVVAATAPVELIIKDPATSTPTNVRMATLLATDRRTTPRPE